MLALRHIWSKAPVERLRALIDLIGQIEDQTEATRILHTLLTDYLSASARIVDDELRTLLIQTAIGETTMQTFAERYREQGREQGRQQGWQSGHQAGEAAVLLRLIERKFGPPSEAVRQRVERADADTLLDWSTRILTEDSLEAVLQRA